MQRSIQRKPIAQARSVILAGLALLVSGTAMAQQPVYICDSDITMDALGEQLKVATCCGRCADCARQILQRATADRFQTASAAG